MRTLIIGGPKVGKTTLALKLGAERFCPVYHTDTLVTDGHDWSGCSRIVAEEWFAYPDIDCIYEGVALPRACRKFLCDPSNFGKKLPWDSVIELWHPYEELSRGQLTMAKGCRTVWDQVQELLRERL